MRTLQLFTVALLVLAAPLTSGSGYAAEKSNSVIWERDDSVPLVYLNLAIRSGAAHDARGLEGLSNFMGEMLLRGTTRRSKEQIDLELDRMGARLDFETRSEFMVIRGAVLSSQLEPYLKLVTEILTQPSFPESEIRKMREQMISEIVDELGNDGPLARRHFQKFIFGDHPYGRTAMGTTKSLERMDRALLLTQYDKVVRSNLFFMSGTGNVDVSRIQDWLAALSKARPGGVVPAPIPAPKLSTTRRYRIIDKPDRTQTQILGGQAGMLVTDPRYFGFMLGNSAFGGGGFLSRLFQEIRAKRGWSYGANSGLRIAKQARTWEFFLFPASKDAPQALALTLKMVEDLKNNGINAKEFEFSQSSMVNNAKFSYNTPGKRTEQALTEQALEVPQGFLRREEQALSQLSLEQVNRALAGVLKPETLNVLVLGTAKEIREPMAKELGIDPKVIEVVPYTEL